MICTGLKIIYSPGSCSINKRPVIINTIKGKIKIDIVIVNKGGCGRFKQKIILSVIKTRLRQIHSSSVHLYQMNIGIGPVGQRIKFSGII